jgi:polar amino acid transport system permease protein
MDWNWEFAWSILPALLGGLKVTIKASVLGFAIAAVLGLALALGRRSKSTWISAPLGGLVEFVRSTPLLVQLFFFFYVLPQYGIRLPAYVVGVFALGLHYSTYTSEVYRAGIDAIPPSQWEAATALNFSMARTWIGIILPQSIPPMIPALGNYLIGMFKESAQLAAITVVELLQTGKIIGSHTFRYLEPITLVGALFLVLSYTSALVLRQLEARIERQHR